MDSCGFFSSNTTVAGTNITFASALNHVLDVTIRPSYLRPNTGGALLPWPYTILIMVIHLPVVIIRVVRWEVIQSWCLVSTLFTVIVYVQAYISTKFDPDKILVWTPLILVIDAGSMLQVFFLVIEAKKVVVGNRVMLMDPPDADRAVEAHQGTATARQSLSVLAHYRTWRTRANPSTEPLTGDTELDACGDPRRPDLQGRQISTNTVQRIAAAIPLEWYRDPAIYAAISALLLFLAVLILQLIGIAKAAKALAASPDPPLVEWCSPLFQPFGRAAIDGDCNVYSIDQSINKGIGCIKISGVWQRSWVKGTVVGTAIELATQVVDFLILSLVNGSAKWRGIKMKRPWATIFAGIIVLFITLIYSINYASTLPPGLTQRVTVLLDIQGPASYLGHLTSGGVRGTLIGWNDGIFESWGWTYFGTYAKR